MERRRSLSWIFVFIVLIAIVGCSTSRNTARSRFYHSLTTRYNVYFNGNEAYKEGLIAMDEGNKDNYMERIPFYPVGNASTVGIGEENFERSIEKAQKAIRQHSIKRKPIRSPGRNYTEKYRQWLKRREFNPFLHNAWMLMGKAQYQKGDFMDAVATFTYIIRLYDGQPKITAEAGIWLSRCYTEIKWYYEAEDLLKKINNDSLPDNLIPAYAASYSNLLLEQERYKDALPYLPSALKNKESRRQRMREHYLLGQVYQHLQDDANAYKAFRKVIRMNPPYDLELNARIRQTEVMPIRDKEKVIKGLRRMGKEEKNKDYLDQIGYALGNAYLAANDTAQAIKEYLYGVEKSTRSGVEKGMLQLRLGDIYWQQGKFEEAQQAYADAISLIDKESDVYAQLNRRSEVLDELVGFANAIQLQDSLQRLASLSEAERIRVIENMMEEIARKEKEEKEAEERRLREEGKQGAATPSTAAVAPATSQQSSSWYFYNPPLVAQGKSAFERTWGKRKAEDNWRRKNKTTVSLDDFAPVDYDEEDAADAPPSDSIPRLAPHADKAEAATSAAPSPADGKDLNFYLKQIPLTEEAMKASNEILSEAIFNLGLLFKDKLDDFPRSERQLLRLIRQFPDFPDLDKAYYNLFLLYSRWEKPAEVERYKDLLTSYFPQSQYAKVVSDPDFVYHAMYAKHLEDSLYADAYKAYQSGDFSRVNANYKISTERYPTGRHRPKLMFLQSMTLLQDGDTKGFLHELKEIVANYPEHEITDLAANILKGVQEGRRLIGDSRLPSVWERRRSDLSLDADSDTLRSSPFSPERETSYLFLLAYEEGTVNENLLLYNVARYNFSNFVVKNFDLDFIHENGIGILRVRSFVNFNEARQYQHQLFANKEMIEKLKGLHAVVISEDNYSLLMEHYSFSEYDRFYQEEMATDRLKEMDLDYILFDE